MRRRFVSGQTSREKRDAKHGLSPRAAPARLCQRHHRRPAPDLCAGDGGLAGRRRLAQRLPPLLGPEIRGAGDGSGAGEEGVSGIVAGLVVPRSGHNELAVRTTNQSLGI